MAPCDGRTTFENEIEAIGALHALEQIARAAGSAPHYAGWYECVRCERWHLSRFGRGSTTVRRGGS